MKETLIMSTRTRQVNYCPGEQLPIEVVVDARLRRRRNDQRLDAHVVMAG